MIAPLAEHVMSLLLEGKMSSEQQKAHAASLLENDEYFDMFFTAVELTDAYLAAMEKPGYDPFKTVIESAQWRRQWRIWRAARDCTGASGATAVVAVTTIGLPDRAAFACP